MSSIVPTITLSLAVTATLGCSTLARTKTDSLRRAVEAGLEAKLEVLSEEENLGRIERITRALLNAEVTRELARELAEGAVLGTSEAARDESFRVAVSAFVDALAEALGNPGEPGLDDEVGALLRDGGAAAARGVLDDSVLALADPFARELSRTVAAALLEQTATQFPAILDASFQRLSPSVGRAIEGDFAPALAASISGHLAPALAAGLEESLGPALEALLADRLLPVLERELSEGLPPLARDSSREAMLGLGEALDGELGDQLRTFVYSLVDGSKERLGTKLRAGSWLLGALATGLLAAALAGVYFWRRAGRHRRLSSARERALLFVSDTINGLPDDLRGSVKSAIAEAARTRGTARSGGVDFDLFLDQHGF